MPTADLDAFCELLPWWVRLGAWIATPLLATVVALAVIWLAERVLRPALTGLHWTEVARLHYAHMRLLGLNSLWFAGLAGVLTYMLASGALVTVDRTAHAVAVGCVVWLAAVTVKIRAARRAFPAIRLRDFISGVLFQWVVMFPMLAVTAAMAILGPPSFEGHALRFSLVYGGGVVASWWVIRGGHLRVASWLGILRPADERANAIIAEASRLSGHEPRLAWIARTAIANAAAIPASNQVLITSRALRDMTHEELVTLMLHEFGHLKESRTNQARRLCGLAFLFIAAMWRPMLGWIGLYAWLGLLVVCFCLTIIAMRDVRRLESDADEHAHEHAPAEDPGLYARSLEKLSRLNMMPVVMHGKGHTHPHMYDRMVAAGVTPDYERPQPPPRKAAQFFILGVLAVSVFVGETVLVELSQDRAYASVDGAMWAVAFSGGSPRAIGALGFHWEEEQPEKAVAALRVAAAHSSRVEYPARLARIQSRTDPAAAKANLELASEGYRKMRQIDEWLREIVDDARERLGLPPEVW